jgi:hypothetical protein
VLFATESANPTKESLACSLVSLISGLRWLSLAEYLLVFRALFSLLLQMVKCTMTIALTACIDDRRQLGPRAMVTLYLSSDAFVGDDYLLALYLN